VLPIWDKSADALALFDAFVSPSLPYESLQRLRRGGRRSLVLAAYLVVQFPSANGHTWRRANPDTDVVAADGDYLQANVIADNDLFFQLASKNQHVISLHGEPAALR
jgi:hypothetical protein